MKQVIVILHGWGKSGKDYWAIQKVFEKKGFRVLSPDMPGFGQETLKKTMDLHDYVVFIKKYLYKEHVKKAVFIGHSFGGRVAAKLAAQDPKIAEKLFLTGSPLIKQPLSFKKQLISFFVKPAKRITTKMPNAFQGLLRKSMYRALGEWDYYKAGKLKETFKKVISEDLKDVLPHISAPTVIIWGERDTFVPISVGKDIARRVPTARFVSIPGASHKLPYENPKVFAQQVLSFLK